MRIAIIGSGVSGLSALWVGMVYMDGLMGAAERVLGA